MNMLDDSPVIAIIGLGYVGLPLAMEFGKKYKTVGFDINEQRINELLEGYDSTHEHSKVDITDSSGLVLTFEADALKNCNFYIITVPTPVDESKRPDLKPLISACEVVGKAIQKDSIVIFESTVYPGLTEEHCVPILESESGMRFNIDFFVGYSPERINPGDPNRKLSAILKITSGSTKETARKVNHLYASIIKAGTYMAPSIKVAEAAKVVENVQRDLNIALMNELSLIFNLMDIDTNEVLEAASTKWNFHHYKPGLVGGHCIAVDPYYLTYKAELLGYHPEVILAGRRVNDNIPNLIVEKTISKMIARAVNASTWRILIVGYTFKENCADLRNTKVKTLREKFTKLGVAVDVFDPLLLDPVVLHEEDLLASCPPLKNYTAIVIAVAHSEILNDSSDFYKNLTNFDGVVFDVKGAFPRERGYLRL